MLTHTFDVADLNAGFELHIATTNGSDIGPASVLLDFAKVEVDYTEAEETAKPCALSNGLSVAVAFVASSAVALPGLAQTSPPQPGSIQSRSANNSSGLFL